MKKSNILFIIAAFIIIRIACMLASKVMSAQKSEDANAQNIEIIEGYVPLPVVNRIVDNEIVNHEYYTLSYNEKHEQPNWVQYIVTREMINGPAQRESAFVEDTCVSTFSAKSADYKKSGFDRGHLCPAADMRLNNKCMSETFYMSNISPQRHQFNAGVWLDLENYVRSLVDRYDSLYVVTGPVLTDDLPCIYGKYNNVSVPEYFYKIIYSEKHSWMLGYLVPHKTNYKTKKELFMYKVPVDSIESLTQIDFFHGVYNEEWLEK